MTRALRGLAALTLFAVAPLAAQDPVADRMLDLGGKPYPVNTACRLSGGDFRLTGATTKLSSALENRIPENKRRLLAEGRDLTLQSIQSGQAGSSKAWYFLGRFYLQQGDLAGADSALTRTVQLAPACAAEIMALRRDAYVSLMSAASAQRAASHADSTAIMARAALTVEPGRPQAWYTVGAFFLDEQQNDSAAWYLEKAVNAPMDSTPNAQSLRQAAAYQVAVVDYNKHDFEGAVRNFAIAVRLKPEDTDAKRNLAASLRQAGMADSASKIEQSMMAEVAGSEGGLTVLQLFDIGVAQFNQHDYANAAATFEKVVAVEPYNRDALFNLAQAYNGAENGDKLLETALRLQAVDPLSYEVMQLVGAGYRAKHDQPNVLKAATALGGATVSVGVTTFSVGANSATLTLKATGREGRDLNDRIVRGSPILVVVEFLDKAGTMVASAETTVPVLAPGATQDLTVTGTGAGIAAWRYRRK